MKLMEIYQTDRQQLDEGVITTAFVVASLTSMLSQVPDVNPEQSKLQSVAQELVQAEVRSPDVTPAVINSPTGISLAFGVSESNLSDVSRITNTVTDIEKHHQSSTASHTYQISENLLISVTRNSREFVKMPDYYNTTCIIDALYTVNGESQAALEMVEFNHKHLGDWADMTKCDPVTLTKIVKDKMKKAEFIPIPSR